jgi:laminin alpha 3/5
VRLGQCTQCSPGGTLRRADPLVPCSLRQLFPSGGSVRGCVKGIKALGKYVDLKRLNTTGISFGCTADLLVSCAPPAPSDSTLFPRCWALRALSLQVGRIMTFYGHGFLPLLLPDVAPLTGEVYSGFGFRSSQDSSLLYYRASPVRLPRPPHSASPGH